MHETQARRGVRRGAAVLLAMVLALSLGWQRTWADEGRQLIPVGKAVGIKLFADGVLVVSVSPVQGTEETRSPAKECGLKEGDILLTFNGEKIRSTEHLQAMLAENGETAAELTVQRDGKTLEVTASPVVCEDGGIRLGAWIRDSMAGVGTLTYTGYFPAGGEFKIIHTIGDNWANTIDVVCAGLVFRDGGDDPGNISVSESGYYKITLDPVKRTCTLEKVANQTPKTFASMFISGAFNDWATTTSMQPVNTFDGAVNHDWYFDLDATSGSTEAKFLADPDWTNNWGGNGFPYGYATSGGDNIPVKPGKYRVLFNDITGQYHFIETEE